jgi:aryl-alcohol dehydrogenase-like predicted oxidoreductase
MEKVRLGMTELHVSPIAFGCSRLGGVFGGASRKDLITLLRSAHEQGINFFDTADIYTQGESERLLGEAFNGRRADVVIASKAGYVLPGRRRLADRIKPVLRPLVRRLGLKRSQLPHGMQGSLSQDFSAVHLIEAVDASLRRLRTDYLDLFQLHSPPTQIIGQGGRIEVLEALRRQGKIRFYGISCETTGDAMAAVEMPIHSLQVRLSLVDQSVADAALVEAAARHVAVIARECLAGGALTKSSGALLQAVEQGLVNETDRLQIERFRSLAERWGRSLTDVALQFVHSQNCVSTVLIGIRDERHLRDTVASSGLAPLSEEESKALQAIRREAHGS